MVDSQTNLGSGSAFQTERDTSAATRDTGLQLQTGRDTVRSNGVDYKAPFNWAKGICKHLWIASRHAANGSTVTAHGRRWRSRELDQTNPKSWQSFRHGLTSTSFSVCCCPLYRSSSPFSKYSTALVCPILSSVQSDTAKERSSLQQDFVGSTIRWIHDVTDQSLSVAILKRPQRLRRLFGVHCCVKLLQYHLSCCFYNRLILLRTKADKTHITK